MREQFLILGRECAAFLFATLFLVTMMSAVYIDVNWMNDAMHETSLTETLQEIMLASVAAMFFWSARSRPAQRGALILTGGFYACMLIRELDFMFDTVEHGSWVWFALATAAACLALALRSPRDTLEGLVTFVTDRSWLMTASGLLIVLVFSRLFGMHQLWQHLMMDGYNRVVKNMAEEGTELLGYSLCWLASVRYLWQTRTAAAGIAVVEPVHAILSRKPVSWSS
ncbi:hypothetical protein [Pantoea sp. KPR_PJ]|uniref:hypothetical protein n=1 Tax=Pantoea sp. KPR_PJ TaxID=2738375 RepID=UPI0035277FB2